MGVTKGSCLLLNNLPLPFPLPPHTHRAPAELPGAALSGHIPPSHSTFTWAKISDFQEKRLKSMTASF